MALPEWKGLRMSEAEVFARLAAGSAMLCAALAAAWLLFNRHLLALFGAGYAPVAGLVARRNAALFLGIALLLWRASSTPDADVRTMVGQGVGLACATLAGLGALEFRCRRAGPWIWLAIATEATLAAAFFYLGV